jgi:acetate kinase
VVIDSSFGESGAKLTHEDLLRRLFAWISQQRRDELRAIGHRVVHGGAVFTAPVRIDHRVIEKLSELEPLAPLHQPHNTPHGASRNARATSPVRSHADQ